MRATTTGPARWATAATASDQTTTSTTRTPDGGSGGSHTPTTTPASSATAAGTAGFVTPGTHARPVAGANRLSTAASQRRCAVSATLPSANESCFLPEEESEVCLSV